MVVEGYRIGRPIAAIWRDRGGLSSIEYGIIAGLLALAAIPALNALGGEVEEGMSNTSSAVASNTQKSLGPLAGNANQNGSSRPDDPSPVGDPLVPETNTVTPDEPSPASVSMPPD